MTVGDLTGKVLNTFATVPIPEFPQSPQPIALSPDGTRLALISFVGTSREPKGAELHMFETDTGKEVFTHKIDRMDIWRAGLTFSRDGKQVAWGYAVAPEGEVVGGFAFPGMTRGIGLAEVRLLDSTNGAEIRRIELGEGAVNSLAFGPDGTRLVTATGGRIQKLTVWDLGTGARLVDLEDLRQKTIAALVYNDDGTRLAGIAHGRGFGEKTEVIVWDAASGKTLFKLPGHSGSFVNIAFSPDGRRIATASGSGPGSGPPGTRLRNEVKLWDASTGNELMTFKDLDRNSVSYLSFSAGGTRLYAVGRVGGGPVPKIEIRSWDATPRAKDGPAWR